MVGPNSKNADNILNGIVKKTDPSLTTRAIRQFIEYKLHGADGGKNLNEIVFNKGNGLSEDFLSFLTTKPEFDEVSDDQRKSFKNVNSAQFLRETIGIGVGFESKRRALEKVIEREFTLTSAQKDIAVSAIKTLSLTELTKYVNNQASRKGFITETFPKKAEQPQEQDFRRQLESIFERKTVHLDEDQKQSVSRILVSPHVSEQDIEGILPFFGNLEDKQLLVKYFLPTVTLAELADMGIVTKQEVHSYILNSIHSQITDKNFTVDVELLESIDPRDIIIATELMPESDLDILIGRQGKQEISKRIEEANQEMLKEFETGSTLWLTPDENGRFLPSFQEKLRGLGIKNPEDFREGSYVRGKIRQQDGTFQNFHFAITGIDDDPARNRGNGWNKKQITVMNVLTSDGFVNKNWKKDITRAEMFSYDSVFKMLEKAVKGKKWFPEIMTQEVIEAQIESGDVKEKVLREDISSLSALNEALDTIDTNGKKYPLQKGSSVQVGKPGDKNFWVFQIKSINETDNTIALSDGTSREILSFQEFFDTFESHNGTRLPKIEGPREFLEAIQSHSPKAKAFEKIVYDKDRWVFVPEDKKDDKDFPGILQFGGEKKTITFHSNDASGLAVWTIGDWDEKWRKYKAGSEGYKAGWNALYAQFLTFRATPIVRDAPLAPPEQKDAKMHEKHGYLKHYMGNPSLHDMFTGAKNLVGFIKHKLEHGSKLHAAKFQLALGKKLGFSEAMMRELRNQVHGSTRELMEKAVKELSSLPSGERQVEVKHILENKGSHDYEIQAAILSMLKKHGTLYVGALKPLEGSFAYFERLSGTKYGPDNVHVQRALKASKEKGILFREEFLIENYLFFKGRAEGGYAVDWNLWIEVKKAWPEGMKAERDSGEGQADTFGTLDGRLNWVYEKFEWGEYSNGIGAMKKVWSKWGAPHRMHEPAIYLALSNISTRLHGSQLDALKNEFYGGGHPYPALTALFTPEKLATFQKTVKILSEGNLDMKTAYENIEKARSQDVGATIKAIKSFWNTYGPELHKKLLISQDPEILYRSQYDTDPETRGILESYVRNYKGDTEAMGRFNDDELGEGVYNYDHSGYVWSTDAYLNKLKINEGPGTFNSGDQGTQIVWDSYLKSLDMVKNIPMTDDPVKHREFQLGRFREHHKAFYKLLPKISVGAFKDIDSQSYMGDLKKRGFSTPLWRDMSKLDTPEYDHIVQKDFDDYMNIGKGKTAHNETEVVAMSIHDLLDRPAMNNPESQQAA